MDHTANFPFMHQNTSTPALPGLAWAADSAAASFADEAGCWKLGAGSASTVRASRAGVLRIAHGRVWLTFNTAGHGPRVRTGDYFLSRGQSLLLAKGEAVVMESYGLGHVSPAWFSWEPVAAVAAVHVPEATGWQAGVAQPLLELRAALRQAARAVGRLGYGLVGRMAASAEATATGVAILFVAARALSVRAERRFYHQAGNSDACCRTP